MSDAELTPDHQGKALNLPTEGRPLRLLLDLQGAQSNSRLRGIGRYSLSMAKAFAEAATKHEVWVSLNGRHDESSDLIIEQLSPFVPRQRFIVNELPAHISGADPHATWRRKAARIAQSACFDSLSPDFIWHSSLFEGWHDDSTVTLGDGADDQRHVATLYDLIPLVHPARHLAKPDYRAWYYRRLALLKRCGLLLAISSSTKQEAEERLHIPGGRIAVIHGAADAVFRPTLPSTEERACWRQAWRIDAGFVLYAGGYDAHKNVDSLLVAYAALPEPLRKAHPLVLAGRCDEGARQHLMHLARRSGLPATQVVFTGGISDEVLAKLYSACTLFVTPSLHEGLGLPALEAMACGAAVIGSNTTSLPEVIGRQDALFDPRSPSAIANKLREVLESDDRRAQLRAHGLQQSARFNWQRSARLALDAIEARAGKASVPRATKPRPSLLYVSPLPPLRTGIADYSANLLRDLASHFDIEVVTDQARVTDPWVDANFKIRSPQWLSQQPFDRERRLLYHFGNSPFHAHMFALLRQHPGVVMLHDSALGSLRNWMAEQAADDHAFLKDLYASHGYSALVFDQQQGRSATINRYPINIDVFAGAMGVLVHSQFAVDLAREHYGQGILPVMAKVPFPKSSERRDRRLARRLLGIPSDAFVVCSFGILASTKLNHRLLDAWCKSSLANDPRCHLVFVGEPEGGEYSSRLRAQLDQWKGASRIHVTGFAAPDQYADYLSAADVSVQLRTSSRGETSAAIFDAIACGSTLIFNAHGSATEIPDDAGIRLVDQFEDSELTAALEHLYRDPEQRLELARAATAWLEREHHPVHAAERYRDAIEGFVTQAPAARVLSRRALLEQDMRVAGVNDAGLADIIGANSNRLDKPRFYVDVTATARSLHHAGIERVVCQSLRALFAQSPSDYRIEPVRIEQGVYVHATDFTLKLLGLPKLDLPESVALPRPGDILFSLDWAADTLPAHESLLGTWRTRGARIIFGVHDLLPALKPGWFPEGIAPMHQDWLRTLARQADAIVCVSRHVAGELRTWFAQQPGLRKRALALGYFYSGSDPVPGTPPLQPGTRMSSGAQPPSFLMVGTVEPRKGHALALDAMEQLWASGVGARLVIVGRLGWMSEALAERMRRHPAAGELLIWIEQADDAKLDELYRSSTALIAASEAEGFGLPLVEAARYGLPVIARDIPIFREVAGDFATFFDGQSAERLTSALEQAAQGKFQRHGTGAASVLSWRESAARLWRLLHDSSDAQWLSPWVPGGGAGD